MIIIKTFEKWTLKGGVLTLKKILTFIPLGVAISAFIIYVLNVFNYKVINNSVAMLQILSNLKIYLYVSIGSFVLYFLIRVIDILSSKRKPLVDASETNDVKKKADNVKENAKTTNNNERFKEVNNNSYIPNYDYVPMYHEEKKGNYLSKEDIKDNVIMHEVKNDVLTNQKNISKNAPEKNENKTDDKSNLNLNTYCYNCGAKINYNDKYCGKCGVLLKASRKNINPVLKSLINILEIVILILIIYFLLNMLFEYKEKTDSNFESPFKISMTK